MLIGFVGLVLSILLLMGAVPKKTKFKENNLVDYAKLTYTIKYKVYCQNSNTKKQFIQFFN